MCELVSESPKFPASREKTGNFHRLALRSRQITPNIGANPKTYEEIPYASEQGIFAAEQGIKSADQGIFQPDQGPLAICRRRKADPTAQTPSPLPRPPYFSALFLW
jgi:hypothetical protein